MVYNDNPIHRYPPNMFYPFPRFGDSLSIASELQQKDKERNQSSFMEADVNIENYLKELREDETYDDPIQEDPELAKTAFAMEQSVAYESMHQNRLSHMAHGASATVYPFVGRGISLGPQLTMANSPMLSQQTNVNLDDPMDDVFNFDVPHSSHHQGPIISTTAPLITKVKHEPWEDEPSTSATTRPTPTPPKNTVPKFATPALPRPNQTKTQGNGYQPTTKARKYNLKPREEKETTNYKIKRMRNNDAVRRSRMKAKEEQEKRDKELQDLKDDKKKLEQENKILRSAMAEMQRKCRCGGIGKI